MILLVYLNDCEDNVWFLHGDSLFFVMVGFWCECGEELRSLPGNPAVSQPTAPTGNPFGSHRSLISPSGSVGANSFSTVLNTGRLFGQTFVDLLLIYTHCLSSLCAKRTEG